MTVVLRDGRDGRCLRAPDCRRGQRFIADLLYGVTPHDPMVFGTIATVVPVVAAFASLLPAWRAIRIQPAESLRAD